MNAIFNVVSMEEFKRISNVEVSHTAWKILQTIHEGTKAVKINKLQQLTSRFESISTAYSVSAPCYMYVCNSDVSPRRLECWVHLFRLVI